MECYIPRRGMSEKHNSKQYLWRVCHKLSYQVVAQVPVAGPVPPIEIQLLVGLKVLSKYASNYKIAHLLIKLSDRTQLPRRQAENK